MSDREKLQADRENRLGEAVAWYYQAAEAGKPSNPADFLARFPDLRPELESFLADKNAFERVKGYPVAPRHDPDATLPPSRQSKANTASLIPTGDFAATLPPSRPEAVVDGPLGSLRYFGDYELLSEIARGGMGVVFRARQVSLNREVALKMILTGQQASALDVARFHTEAEAAANLDHPNILPIYEIGEHLGQHYFAMKFVSGGSLAAKVEEFVKNPEQAVVVFEKVCRAVDFAHRRGILHRDLKPGNILLDDEGTPYVTDFGLAKKVEGDSGLTQSGAIIGTPSYMAPEQARAEKALTTSVDVYALGALLYELLTGQPPFRAPIILDTILQVLEKEPTDPRSINQKADRDLSLIALKCLEKEPAKRYESAAALADDLHHWLKGEPISVRPMRRTERLLKWARRHPSIAALATVLTVVCIVGFFTVLSFWRLAEERRGKAEKSADDANDQKQIAQQERDLANDLRRQSLFEQVRSERATGDRWHSLALAKEVASMKVTPELRQEAIQTATSSGFRQVCKLGPRFIYHGQAEGPFVDFHRDGTMIATSEALQKNTEAQMRLANGIKVWDIPSGNLLGDAECDNFDGGFAFSPTAHVMALAKEGQVRLWEPKTGKETDLFQGSRPVRFSPDGGLLAALGKDGCIVWDMLKNKQLQLHAPGRPVAFVTPDKLLVRNGQRLSIWNVRTGTESFKSPDGWSPISATYDLSQLTRGDSLVAMRRDEAKPVLEACEIGIWDVDSGKKITGFPKLGYGSFSGSYPMSPNAGLLAVQDPADPLTIQLHDLATGQLRRRLTSPFPSKGVLAYGRFNDDGTMLAAQELGDNPTVRVWNVETGDFFTALHDRENPVWSADGRFLAVFGPGKYLNPDGSGVSGNRHAVIVYEIAYGAPTYRLPSTLHACTFSKDSHRFAAQETVWDVVDRSGTMRMKPIGVSTAIPAGSFAASGDRLWTRGQSGIALSPAEPVKLWQVFPEKREVLLAGVKRTEPGYIQNFAVSPDGGLALVEWVRRVSTKGMGVSMEGQLEFWNLVSGKRLMILNLKSKFGFYQDWPILQFSPNGKLMFIKETNGNLEIWDSETPRKLREVESQTEIKQGQFATHIIRNAIFSANGESLFTCSDTGRVDKIDVKTGKSLASWKVPDEEPRVLALHPTESFLAVGGNERTIYLLDATDSGRELARWQGHDVSISALTFSPDGRTLVSGSRDGVIKLWDLPRIRGELKAVNLDW